MIEAKTLYMLETLKANARHDVRYAVFHGKDKSCQNGINQCY